MIEGIGTKVRTIEYEFSFASGKTLQVAIFPDDGDIAIETADGWVFTIARLHKVVRVFTASLAALECTEREILKLTADERLAYAAELAAKRSAPAPFANPRTIPVTEPATRTDVLD